MFKILLPLSNVFNIAPFHIVQQQICESKISAFHLTRISLIFALTVAFINYKLKQEMHYFHHYVDIIDSVGVAVISSISILTVYFKKTIAKDAIKGLQNIEGIFESLRIDLHGTFLRTVKYMQLGLLTLQVIHGVYIFIKCLWNDTILSNVYLLTAKHFFVVSVYLSLYQYSTEVLVIWDRFKRLNLLLKKCTAVQRVQRSCERNMMDILKMIRKIQYDMCTNAQRINEVYGGVLLLSVGLGFVVTTLELYQFYKSFEIMHFVSVVLQMLRLLCVVLPSGLLKQEVRCSQCLLLVFSYNYLFRLIEN